MSLLVGAASDEARTPKRTTEKRESKGPRIKFICRSNGEGATPRDCWRNRDEAVRQRFGLHSRLAAVAQKGGDDRTPCSARRVCCLSPNLPAPNATRWRVPRGKRPCARRMCARNMLLCKGETDRDGGTARSGKPRRKAVVGGRAENSEKKYLDAIF